MKHVEHLEQTKFIQRVRHTRKDILCFAVPNGGYRKRKEAIRLKAEGVLAGVPDIMVAQPTEDHCGLFLEFKTEKGRASDKQKVVMAKLQKAGYKAIIVRSADEAWEALLKYLKEE